MNSNDIKKKYEAYLTDSRTNERFKFCTGVSYESVEKCVKDWYLDQINPKWKSTEEDREWATKVYNSLEIVEREMPNSNGFYHLDKDGNQYTIDIVLTLKDGTEIEVEDFKNASTLDDRIYFFGLWDYDFKPTELSSIDIKGVHNFGKKV